MALTKITPEIVAVNAIQGTLIADNAITTVHIANNAVESINIAENNVTAREIAANIITVTQLADDAVEADKIADGVITTNHLNKAMISSQTEVTAVSGDYVLIGDTSDSNNLKKATVSDFATDITGKLSLSGGTMTGNITIDSAASAGLTLDRASTSTGSTVDFKTAGTLKWYMGLRGLTNDNFYLRDEVGSTNALTVTSGGNLTVAGTLGASAGSASAPSLYMGGDTNTGLYSVAGDNIGFATGGTARGFWSATQFNVTGNGVFSGNGTFGGTLGVTGAVTASARLNFAEHVIGSSATGYIQLTSGSGKAWALSQGGGGAPGTDRNAFGVHHWNASAWSNPLMIDSDGKVGIGTTSPDGPLHVMSASAGSVSAHASADELVVEGSANAGINILSGNSNEGGIYFGDDGDNDIGRIRYDHSNNSLDFFVNAGEKMQIDSSGRVGINRVPGISNSKLEVGGADNVPLINVEASGVTGGMGVGSTGLQLFHGTTSFMAIDSVGRVKAAKSAMICLLYTSPSPRD